MRVISFRMIREFFDIEPGATIPLKLWYKKVQKADWDNFSEMKHTFLILSTATINGYPLLRIYTEVIQSME